MTSSVRSERLNILQTFQSRIMLTFSLAGPDERFGILAELFDIPLKKAKALGIEPPLYVDYGTNIKFKGDFYANFGLTVLGEPDSLPRPSFAEAPDPERNSYPGAPLAQTVLK